MLNMDNVRKARLRALIESPRFGGSQQAFADAAGLSKGRVTQLLDPKEPFGERAARSYAEKLELEPGYFDRPLDDAERDFEPLHPPTIEQSVLALAELLLHLDDDGRSMASTALSNLARNPRGAAKAAQTLEHLAGIHPREPDPPTPVEAGAGTQATKAPGKAKLTVRAGGGQKMQLDLPLRTVADPFDKSAAPPREREWYARVKAAPKAADKPRRGGGEK